MLSECKSTEADGITIGLCSYDGSSHNSKSGPPSLSSRVVYGQDLRLPSEFKSKIKHDFFQRDTQVHSLKEFVKELKPVPTRGHAEKKSFAGLQICFGKK